MSFVWNDEVIEFIKPDKVWNKKEFALVHTLYVQLNEIENSKKDEQIEELTERILFAKLKKYGPIEKIEIHTHKDIATKKYAYIRFRENKDAFLAYLDTQRLREPYLERSYDEPRRKASAFMVIPADTWRQPSVAMKTNTEVKRDVEPKGDQTTIEQLNDNCLIKIFEYCERDTLIELANVNERFNGILDREIFRKQHKIKLNFDRGYKFRERTDMTLRRMRRILLCIGKYLREGTFGFNEDYAPQNIIRIFYIFAKYVSPNMKKLVMNNFFLEDAHVDALKLVFANLEILKIQMDSAETEHDINFRSYCPKLKKFNLLQNILFTMCAAEPWPSLENFSMVNNQVIELHTQRQFMRNNPQLKRLKLTAYSCIDMMQSIADNLPNLEKLTAYDYYVSHEITASNLIPLTSLKHLNTLKLIFLDKTNFDGILRFLPRLSNLQKLKLHLTADYLYDDEVVLFLPNQSLVIALAQELLHLRTFHIAWCQLNDSVVVDFIRHAEKLEEFCMHRCDVRLSTRLIYDIVDVRKQAMSLNLLPLKVIVDPYDGQNVKEVANDPEIQKFVKIAACSDCRLRTVPSVICF